MVSCSRAAARKVSAAASSTLSPLSHKWRVSLPIEVVLPAPLTPATMMTVGRCSPITSAFSSGCSRLVSVAVSMFFNATGCVTPVSFTLRRNSSSRYWVAGTPASDINSASSRLSYSASSMTEPPKTMEMLEAVLPRLALSLSTHFCRAGGVAGATGISMGVTSALPMSEPLLPLTGIGGGAVIGAAGGFFLKKLNMNGGVGGPPFYVCLQANESAISALNQVPISSKLSLFQSGDADELARTGFMAPPSYWNTAVSHDAWLIVMVE